MRDVGHAVGVAAIRVERAAPLPLVGVVPQALGIAQADVDVVHQLAEPFVITPFSHDLQLGTEQTARRPLCAAVIATRRFVLWRQRLHYRFEIRIGAPAIPSP